MYRVAGISFEHMHMLDNLRMVESHENCELVAVCDADPSRLEDTCEQLSLRTDRVFTNWEMCIEKSRPDFIILCPSTGDHALWVDRLAPIGLPLMIEKPMAASLADADQMIATCKRHDTVLAINWPAVWVPSHAMAKRLVEKGRIGKVIEVHYYGGNRGPLWHTADKREVTAEDVRRQKPKSWFYSRAQGGGSMLDYLGYGATLGTWYMDGRRPIEVTAVVDRPAGLDVDEHSITIARYEEGLSKFETRWGTYTDPWTHQPQPKCGFVLVGTEGTISSFDYAPTVRVQDAEHPEGIDLPAEPLAAPNQNPVQYFVDCLDHGRAIEGPLSPEVSRIGQQIVETAYESAARGETLPLIG